MFALRSCRAQSTPAHRTSSANEEGELIRNGIRQTLAEAGRVGKSGALAPVKRFT
jgi:hypothetical protein